MRGLPSSERATLTSSDSRDSAPQDFKLAERIAAEGKACVVVVNKWDTVPNKETNTLKTWEEAIRDRLRSLSWAPMIFISAATGQRVPK